MNILSILDMHQCCLSKKWLFLFVGIYASAIHLFCLFFLSLLVSVLYSNINENLETGGTKIHIKHKPNSLSQDMDVALKGCGFAMRLDGDGDGDGDNYNNNSDTTDNFDSDTYNTPRGNENGNSNVNGNSSDNGNGNGNGDSIR